MKHDPFNVNIKTPINVPARGFTLLELLIAISLSTLLMTVLVVGLNQITRDWERRGGELDALIDHSLLLLQIEKAILGTFAYNYKKNATAEEQLFFEGTQHSLKWVSTVSPDRSSGLTLWQLQADQEKGLQLVTMPAYPGDLNKQLERFRHSLDTIPVYFENYKVSFHYLKENTKKIKQWSTNWQTKDKKTLPLGIRMTFENTGAGENEAGLELFSFISVNSKSRTGARIPFGIGTEAPEQVTPGSLRDLFKGTH